MIKFQIRKLMVRHLLKISFFGFFILFLGCESKQEEIVEPSPYDGLYISELCSKFADNEYSNVSISFAGEQIATTNHIYSDEDCTEIVTELRAITDFELVDIENEDLDDGIQALNLTLESADFTIYTSSAVSDANDKSLYGYDDWEKGESQDITGEESQKDADDALNKGQNSYDLMLIEGGTLCLGKKDRGLDASAEDKRPREIGEDCFEKQ